MYSYFGLKKYILKYGGVPVFITFSYRQIFVKIYMNFHWEAQRARGEAASLKYIVEEVLNYHKSFFL